MLGKTVLLYTDDRAAGRTLAGHLRGAGNEVVIADGPAAAETLLGARAVDLVFVDGAAPSASEVLSGAHAAGAPAVVLSAGDPAAMLEMVCGHGVEHVLVRSGDGEGGIDDLAREVVVTAEKILRKDLFGIEKYLPSFGVEVASHEVRGASDRDVVVERISEQVEWLGAGREARRAVAAIVDELVTNAVYDAPRDATGTARYHSTDRKTKVQLDPWEFVTVRWGSDGEHIAISVTDWFGSLLPEHVRGGLIRCLTAEDQIEQKAGGAGIGLYTALSYSAQLVVNVDRGVRTEIIAIVDLRRRNAGARRAGRSLHLFFEDSRAVPTDVSTAPETVVVSDSMLVDLRAQFMPKPRRRTTASPFGVPTLPGLPAARARGSSPPPLEAPIGAGAVADLLADAASTDRTVQIGLRFLANHYETAIAYAVEARAVEARHASGRVADWPHLRELRLERNQTASLAALSSRQVATAFRPMCPMDQRLAQHATGDADAAGLVMPLHVDGELRWILYAVRPRDEAPVGRGVVETVRRALTSHLENVDPTRVEMEIAVS
jgi:hypothetical protein